MNKLYWKRETIELNRVRHRLSLPTLQVWWKQNFFLKLKYSVLSGLRDFTMRMSSVFFKLVRTWLFADLVKSHNLGDGPIILVT